ncbi:unnamed protein product [Strongylus vulgaris]|uniref:Abnormal cell migration protein 18-like fibronectin type I domain-containing protein n=1 Tax=Strongylus vulgaris TaxID=40348 RepID=A0A3P7J1K5_STRVU|nr:unnamed protein product [Strongylus vulgaris]
MIPFTFLLIIPYVLSSCVDNGVKHAENEKWVRNGNFLVTCAEGEIKVLNCLTDGGTVLELGTVSYVENGVEYSCTDDEPVFEGSGEEISVNNCPDNADGSDDITIGHFLICCISKRFKGCVDDYGDSVKTGHFVIGKGLLKYCNIQKNGLRARIEPKGCFNGTRTDDVEDVSLHIKKYAVWKQGAYDMRCGDDGIQVYRCYVGNKTVYVGQAWIDNEGIVNICK